jgi:hypothetical protein
MPEIQKNDAEASDGGRTTALFGDLYVIEARHRKENKDLSDWKFVAAFKERQDAYDYYGRYHQRTCSRILPPSASAPK